MDTGEWSAKVTALLLAPIAGELMTAVSESVVAEPPFGSSVGIVQENVPPRGGSAASPSVTWPASFAAASLGFLVVGESAAALASDGAFFEASSSL